MAGLAVNIDHIATLRQARGAAYPDPVAAAVLAELAGADGIVAHLREDRRHVQDRDVRLLRQTVRTKLVLEMAATPEMIGIAREIRPDLVTLVPEKRTEITTEGGLDMSVCAPQLLDAIARLHDAGIPVSLFLDPEPAHMERARDMHADVIEIHTGAFCDANSDVLKDQEFSRIIEAAKTASRLGLGVNAGHGLGYHSIKWFKGLREIDEFSIGHSIVSRAALVGMDQAVRDMKALIKQL